LSSKSYEINLKRDISTLESDIVRISKGDYGTVVVDLEGMSFLVSVVIFQLVKIFKYCKRAGITFRIINAGSLYNTFEMLKLTELFEVTP